MLEPATEGPVVRWPGFVLSRDRLLSDEFGDDRLHCKAARRMISRWEGGWMAFPASVSNRRHAGSELPRRLVALRLEKCLESGDAVYRLAQVGAVRAALSPPERPLDPLRQIRGPIGRAECSQLGDLVRREPRPALAEAVGEAALEAADRSDLTWGAVAFDDACRVLRAVGVVVNEAGERDSLELRGRRRPRPPPRPAAVRPAGATRGRAFPSPRGGLVSNVAPTARS